MIHFWWSLAHFNRFHCIQRQKRFACRSSCVEAKLRDATTLCHRRNLDPRFIFLMHLFSQWSLSVLNANLTNFSFISRCCKLLSAPFPKSIGLDCNIQVHFSSYSVNKSSRKISVMCYLSIWIISVLDKRQNFYYFCCLEVFSSAHLGKILSLNEVACIAKKR